MVSSHSGTPLGVGTSHGHFGPQDSPRPGFGGSHASKHFQWHQEHLNARCFGPCCRTLNIWESRRTPSPRLWKRWASPPHLAQVGLRQTTNSQFLAWKDFDIWFELIWCFINSPFSFSFFSFVHFPNLWWSRKKKLCVHTSYVETLQNFIYKHKTNLENVQTLYI